MVHGAGIAVAEADPIDTRPEPPGRWRVGTLVYTGGGLLALFLLLLAGDFAWSMKERSVGPVFTLLLKVHGASDLLVGLLTVSVPAVISLVLGPVVSVWSDRARTRFGRRIPFLALPTPFIVLAMAGLGFSPGLGTALAAAMGWGDEGRRWAVLLVFAGFWTVFEVFTIVANSVFNGLVNDVVPRAWIGRFFGLFRGVSLIAGMCFNYALIGHAETRYQEMFLALALVYAVGFTVMCLGVREGAYPPPPAREPSRGMLPAVGGYLRTCLGHPFYRLVLLCIAVSGLCFAPLNVFSIYAAKSFGLSTGDYGQATAWAYGVSLVLAFPLGWLTDRFHPVVTGGVALVLYAAAMAVAALAVQGPVSFSAAWIAHVVLSGSFFTTTAGLGLMLFPRLRFSQFASAGVIAAGLGSMLFAPAFGWVLDRSGIGYRATFLVGAVLAVAACLCWWRLARAFHRLGGRAGYQAPEV